MTSEVKIATGLRKMAVSLQGRHLRYNADSNCNPDQNINQSGLRELGKKLSRLSRQMRENSKKKNHAPNPPFATSSIKNLPDSLTTAQSHVGTTTSDCGNRDLLPHYRTCEFSDFLTRSFTVWKPQLLFKKVMGKLLYTFFSSAFGQQIPAIPTLNSRLIAASVSLIGFVH